MVDIKIPIAKPLLAEEEAAAAREVILSGWVTQGPKVQEFEGEFSKFVGSKHACAVSNCTAALHIALLTVGVKPGDVVITVSHSFIATANAIRYCNAEPLFIDIDPHSYNINTAALLNTLTEDCEERRGGLYYKHLDKLNHRQSPLLRTSGNTLGRVAAIMTVHQMGMPCDMEEVLKISKRFGLPVVEDAACAIGSEIEIGGAFEKIGRPHGDIACFSFHPRKVITTGDGGMLTTANDAYDKQFRLLRQHAMSLPDTVRHNSKKVVFEEYQTTAFNYRMTDIQGAVGVEQLKKLPQILSERRELAAMYDKLLSKISWIEAPRQSSRVRSNWQSYPVRILDTASHPQTDVMQHLLDLGISTRRGIMNIHQEPAYSPNCFSLPESEKARDSVILLPLYSSMTESDLKSVVDALKAY